ncbi:hypothetical protein L6R44_11065 [Enterobacter cloacae complex sp. ECC445]|uniref:hypothetical protein n=1 Tax=Enterobacter cloacae complex sp. ECC445 TaxID=2913213 RepID=UPI001F359D63|nr:hypothetical protein [Enterobacter cloacae complex sp. ECC445]MCG0456646.1 hypothetical protein [Enterobacter cloacae complex sp. ECC445]
MFKTRLSVLCFAVASLLTLSSCDAYEAAYDETLNDNAPQIVIAGGFKMDIQGNSVPVEGFDKCTQSTIQGIVGHEKSNCIVLDKIRKNVPVLVHWSSGPLKEEWKIEHLVNKTNNGRSYVLTRLIRPDGKFVVPASSELGFFSGKYYSQAS